MAQETFKRYEKKYILDEDTFTPFFEELRQYIKADEYGDYTICNVYYDTPLYELIQRSIAKPFYKEKLRLRSYGKVGEADSVFLEIKKKSDGVVYKRRKQMPLPVAMAYTKAKSPLKDGGQIGRELDWFLQRYQVEPKVYIAYDRQAFKGIEDDRLRITFDRRIRYREDRLDLAQETDGTLLMEEGWMVMEIKIPGSVPFWLARLLSKYKIYPTSFSKYGTYYKQKLLKERKNVR